MEISTSKHSTEKEVELREKLVQKFNECPMPDHELIRNFGLYINRIALMRILYMNELYQNIVGVHGDVIEFGCRWGQNLSLFLNYRGILEPFNMQRKVIGFDTFTGLKGIDNKDKQTEVASIHGNEGDYAVTQNYDTYLKEILDYHAQESPAAQIVRHNVIKGDASVEIKKYLKEHPETVVALAYFDMDIYKPTRDCLEAIKPYLTKGSVVGFDELNSEDFPGETIAFHEVLGANNFRMVNSKYGAGSAYLIYE